MIDYKGMCRWLNSKGEVIRTRTIREFAERFGMSVGVARQLHSGQRSRIQGFCSMAPKAKRHRKRFLTTLVNTRTGARLMVGKSVRQLARDTGLCLNELYKLINGRKLMYRGWCLERALEVISDPIADGSVEKPLSVISNAPTTSRAISGAARGALEESIAVNAIVEEPALT